MRNRPTIICLSAALGLFAAANLLGAEKPPAGAGKLFLVPTTGGMQFWADELFFHKWRIQRNVLTGHCRLLDGNNLRHTWGSFAQCRARLDEIRRRRKLPPMKGKAVIVLHGMFRGRPSMGKLCKYLEKHGGYTVFNVGYPSIQREVAAHARSLVRIVENLDGIQQINFVAHSMGNIVVRHYLADQTNAATGKRPDPRIKRFVMLAPPNHGSLVALVLSENNVLNALGGKLGEELGREWAKLEGKLGTPGCQFGIIAGGKGNHQGYNPILPGDDDGVVTVASTRLAGAGDFVVLPVLHISTMNDAKVLEYTLRFFQKGYFISEKKRQPLVKQ